MIIKEFRYDYIDDCFEDTLREKVEVETFENGHKTTIILCSPCGENYSTKELYKTVTYYNNNGERHREDGPAVVIYDCSNGNIIKEIYCINGQYHRLDGPAIIKYDGHKPCDCDYYIANKKYCFDFYGYMDESDYLKYTVAVGAYKAEHEKGELI